MSKETEPSEGKTTLPTRELVLCFDGTGNTFRADGGESNILKIFRMLDRTKENRYCYYQPGIGTDVTMASFSSLAYQAVANLPTSRIVDQALATSFNDHVISGYRFLARRWVPGSRIYLFGFSRGAYTARFLNEMLDFAGLISADNEETIPFVWDAFIRWKFAESEQEIKETEASLRMCRETMCRSPGLVHFLGLFDTVNSVAEFSRVVDKEIEVRPSPKIMRHAVSIDEKRIKFQPVLFKPPKLFGEKPKISRTSTWAAKAESAISHSPRLEGKEESKQEGKEEGKGEGKREEKIESLKEDKEEGVQDFEEVYFAGDHSDVGGGWPSEKPGPSQIPLMWMVQEAIWAELTFDPIQLKRHGCFNPRIEDYDPKILEAAERAQIHDSLGYDSGRGVETLFWRVMEYLPIKRPKVGPDGNVRETRWHGRGLRRPLPEEAKIHASVLHRLGYDREYRPFNLGMGNKTTVEEKREELQQLTRWKRVVHDKLCEYWVKMPDERARQ